MTVYFGKRLEKFPKETIWKGELTSIYFDPIN